MTTKKNSPVDFTFIDSGTGGIPYMLYLKEKSPLSKCLYLGDSRNFPYGEKTPEQITACASEAVSLVISKWNPKAIVIACNTISVTALDDLRKRFPTVPIVGTVPAIKLAAETTRNKRIGLLATNATVRHPYNKRLVEEFASDCKVFSRGDADLIAFIEHNLFTATDAEKRAAVQPAVTYFRENDCDTIILGCTHFVHLAEIIQSEAGSGVKVIDSREGVARQALKVEQEHEAVEENVDKKEKAGTSSLALPDDGTLFVTGFTQKKDDEEYRELCKNLHIPFGGILH